MATTRQADMVIDLNDESMSLREAMVGMIHEYARHLGHPTSCVSGSTDA
jgi:hypothetical protein